MSRFKLFSDPVHGFISVPKRLLLSLVQTPEYQRLRRIRQLGVGFLVFPGAEHTRFGHGLGAMALMQETLQTLSEKGTPISPHEAQAAMAAALLHDIGHGPFSHSLEHELIRDFAHEQMSRQLLVRLNDRFDGQLACALDMFDDIYARPFFHQLVSSQLDMDRLDYLRRDSFYTGVAEGVVGVERMIKTMRVDPIEGGPGSEIVIEAKGAYAVENFLLSRRLMYWQVYLHKTVLSGDHLLRSIFDRVRALLADGTTLPLASPALLFFLHRDLTATDIADPEVQTRFCQLDDTDVLFSLKQWIDARDPILADLCRRFIDRDFFRVTFLNEMPSASRFESWKDRVEEWMKTSGLTVAGSHDVISLYLGLANSRQTAYLSDRGSISVLTRDGRREELSKTTGTMAVAAMTEVEVKPYVCYPKEVELGGMIE